MKKVHVILSGGVGSRLWPLSTKSRPKQFIPIFDKKTLFQLTIERNWKLVDCGIVIVNKDNEQLAVDDLKGAHPNIGYEFVVESVPRNTACAIAFAAFSVNPNDILFVTPSDHIIENEELYTQSINRAFELAANNKIVTLGITPKNPSTEYGYIQHQGEDVLAFHEKPTIDLALNYIKDGQYVWNSGMFCFKAEVYLQELKKNREDVYETSLTTWRSNIEGYLSEVESLQIPSVSIDYAVMEKAKNISVVPASFKWSDLGSFEALYDYFANQSNKDYMVEGNLIISENNMHVEAPGLNGMVIVQKGNSLLILDKSKSHLMKDVYNKLVINKDNLV